MTYRERKERCLEAILYFLEAKATLDAFKEDWPIPYLAALEEVIPDDLLKLPEEFKKVPENEPEA